MCMRVLWKTGLILSTYTHTHAHTHTHWCSHSWMQAGGNTLVLEQTTTFVERAISLAPLNPTYVTEVVMNMSGNDQHTNIPSDVHVPGEGGSSDLQEGLQPG